jgi:hypothetical protein
MAPFADLISDLVRQNQALSAAAAMWQERARHLGERLTTLEAGSIAGDVPQEREPGPRYGDVDVEAAQIPSSPEEDQLIPEEQAVLAAAMERERERCPQSIIPDGMTVQEAMAWYITKLDELKQSRRDQASRAPNSRA